MYAHQGQRACCTVAVTRRSRASRKGVTTAVLEMIPSTPHPQVLIQEGVSGGSHVLAPSSSKCRIRKPLSEQSGPWIAMARGPFVAVGDRPAHCRPSPRATQSGLFGLIADRRVS